MEAEKEAKRAEKELIRRFRGEAFRQKMRLFAIFLVANVVFVCCFWMLPSVVIHIVFLIYILLGALPKFFFRQRHCSEQYRRQNASAKEELVRDTEG